MEYRPPVSGNSHATLHLVFTENPALAAVADAMKSEAEHWLRRYPVPIMAFAWDAAENRIQPHGDEDDALLVAWQAADAARPTFAWKTAGLPPFLDTPTEIPDWREIYHDIPFRTDAEVKANAVKTWDKTRKQILFLRVVLVVWLAAIPAAWATFQFIGPHWLEIAVFLYSLWQAVRTAIKLFGHSQPSKAEQEKSAKDLKMAHYFYHCERNPEGFARLKHENFDRETSERNLREAAVLKSRADSKT